MNIYKISQEPKCEYGVYDSAIIAAESEEDARLIHPNEDAYIKNEDWYMTTHAGIELKYTFGTWVAFKDIYLIKVELIGKAKEGTKRGVILASFNAG